MVWLLLLLWINKTESFRGDAEAPGQDQVPGEVMVKVMVEICERCTGSVSHGGGVEVWVLSYTRLYGPSEIL